VSTFINEKLVAVKNKAGKGTLYREYSISAVPQTVFTDSSGEEIGRIVGTGRRRNSSRKWIPFWVIA